MARIGIILVCTRKYDIFLQQFIDSAEKYFFQGEPFDIYLLTDKSYQSFGNIESANRSEISFCTIPSYSFPWATLYRYKEIVRNSNVMTADYLFYSDIDMRFVSPVGEEILCDGLTAVRHPGYHKSNGWGSRHTHPQSLAYLKPEHQHDYYAGGFQGGKRESYLECCDILQEMIEIDLKMAKGIGYTKNNGILAEYHDEVFWNWYCKTYPPKKILDPSYCMVEQMELRKNWGIDDLTPRLIALKKNHQEIRS